MRDRTSLPERHRPNRKSICSGERKRGVLRKATERSVATEFSWHLIGLPLNALPTYASWQGRQRRTNVVRRISFALQGGIFKLSSQTQAAVTRMRYSLCSALCPAICAHFSPILLGCIGYWELERTQFWGSSPFPWLAGL